MFEPYHRALKILCVGLLVLVVYQIASLAARKSPLESLAFASIPIPSTPSVPQLGKPGTNSVPPSGKQPAETPPAIQSRIEKITQSEILGAVIRPMPMALLGIAGKDVFLRAPNGQTGLLREGEELGGVKLLRIGTNRVLVEHEQQQKELTVFSGFGSENLLPKGKANPH